MKKFIITAIAALMMTIPAMAADDGVTVIANGNTVDDKGVIVDGRTLVPVRGVFEKFGFEVKYDANTKTATLTDEAATIIMTNGKENFEINGEVITPDVPQQIIDGRFMLPLRAVGEAIGAEISWDSDTKTASLTIDDISSNTDTPQEVVKDSNGDFTIPGVTIEEINPDGVESDNVNEIVF